MTFDRWVSSLVRDKKLDLVRFLSGDFRVEGTLNIFIFTSEETSTAKLDSYRKMYQKEGYNPIIILYTQDVADLGDLQGCVLDFMGNSEEICDKSMSLADYIKEKELYASEILRKRLK